MDILLTSPSALRGDIEVPPSKSISARALILEALAAGERSDAAVGRSLIGNLSDCDDTQVLLHALTTYRSTLKGDGNALNASNKAAQPTAAASSSVQPDAAHPSVSSVNQPSASSSSEPSSSSSAEPSASASSAQASPLRIDVGAAGTAMRFLTAFFAVQEGCDVELTGSERMKQRPIGPLVDALRRLGADIDYLGSDGFPPLRIRGRRLQGDSVTIRGDVSSQFVSAVLMIAPYVESGDDCFTVTLLPPVTSRPYIDMTLDIMSRYGIDADWSDGCTLVVESGGYSPCRFTVEADWSSASYWYSILVACQFLNIPHDYHLINMPEGRSVTQADARIVDCVSLLNDYAPFYRCDFSQMPDLVQTVAVLFCLVRASFVFTGVGNLRLKETDRLSALCEELQKFGYHLETNDDDGGTLIWKCTPGVSSPFVYDDVRWKQTLRLDPHGDHRMAMAFVPMAMRDGHLVVTHAEVVSKSYPTFWDDLRRLGFGVEEIENEPLGNELI